ncbi:asparagine synthetase (glutamine-hydrolyzing), partial [sediment metagenome]
MCGICGELRFDNQSPDLEAVGRMTAKLVRRGPDSGGSFDDGPLAFGHRRLSVIDLTASSEQPMVDKDLRLAEVFNGTIYNYRELRAELMEMGYAFFSEGDSEVILKAFHAWGERCVEHFFGMFAFAIWDMRHRSLFLARDRFGIKPLYYSLEGVKLRFASTTQALLAAGGVDTSIDPVALHHHLTLHAVVPAPRTLLNGVKKLAPATTLTIDAAGNTAQRVYWSLDATRPKQQLSEQDWLNATRHVLTRAVERHRLASDVPVGI